MSFRLDVNSDKCLVRITGGQLDTKVTGAGTNLENINRALLPLLCLEANWRISKQGELILFSLPANNKIARVNLCHHKSTHAILPHMDNLATWGGDAIDFVSPLVQNWVFGTNDEPGHGISLLTIAIVGAIAYFIGGRIVTRLVKRIVRTARHREWHRKDVEKRQKTLADLFLNIWRIIIISLVLYATLKEFLPGIDKALAPLFASAGIVGVALGFGAQSIIKDFLSGIFIISENQYRVGDIVDIEGASGTVERIGTRSTVIRDVDGNVHYFPNGMVMHVINKTMGYSMARFIVAVHPSSDIEEVSTIVNKLGEELAAEEKWNVELARGGRVVRPVRSTYAQ